MSYNDLQASLGLVLKIGGVDRKLTPNYSITPSIYCNSRIWPAGGKACPYVSGVEARVLFKFLGSFGQMIESCVLYNLQVTGPAR